MRLLCGIIILASALSLSCSRERSQHASQQNPSEPGSLETQSEEASRAKRHVYLSSVDLAKELSEHCGKASDAISHAAALVSARATLDTKKLITRLDEAKKSMSTCMTMVHGVEENALGAGAEQDSNKPN